VHAAKVEVALGGHVGNVGGNTSLVAQCVDNGGCGRVVNSGKNHSYRRVIKIGWEEFAVDMSEETWRACLYSMSDFCIATRQGCNNVHVGVRI